MTLRSPLGAVQGRSAAASPDAIRTMAMRVWHGEGFVTLRRDWVGPEDWARLTEIADRVHGPRPAQNQRD